MKKSPLRKKAKSKSEGWWRNKADSLMQDINRLSHNKCEVCGGKNEVGHHYITKQTSSYLRYEWSNLVPLCNSCHFRHHRMYDPHIVGTINRKRGEEWMLWIESVRRNPIKTGTHFYQSKCTEYQDILDRIRKNDPGAPQSI